MEVIITAINNIKAITAANSTDILMVIKITDMDISLIMATIITITLTDTDTMV